MTKRLILIRHAKSSWDAPFDDHSRTLNNRGRASATALGSYLKMRGDCPDGIYCSDAARTIETTECIVAAMGTTPTIHHLNRMYNASPAALWNVLRKAEGEVVALVSHNPGVAFFAEDAVDKAPDHPRFMDYPTCATLVCDFPTNDWAEAVSHSGQVVVFVVPKDL
jgi:phosphohistidine phosphatase